MTNARNGVPDFKQVERTKVQPAVENRIQDELADRAIRLRNTTNPREIVRIGD